MGLWPVTTRTNSTSLRPDEDVDGNRQSCDDVADEVAGRCKAAACEVDAKLNAAGAAGLRRTGFVEGGAAGFNQERCPVLTIGIRPEIIVAPFFWETVIETGHDHSCEITRFRSSAREVLYP